MIRIYDGNNYTRRFIETDLSGQAPRTIYNAICASPDTTFYVWDALSGNRARRKIFPGYKMKRAPSTGDMSVGFDIVREVLTHSPAIQIQIEGFEGDDIIAVLTRHLTAQGQKVHIHSTDKDYLQLTNESPLVSCDAMLKNGVMLDNVRHYKTLIGDTSDSIPGIPGFGEGAWEKMDTTSVVAWVQALGDRQPLPPLEFPKRCQAWLEAEGNLDLLRSYWDIIGFLPVPEDQLAKHMVVGKFNPDAANTILQRYML